MPEFPMYQIDAFTNRVFGGNPAAVCPLEAWLPDGVLQSIAAENNLSETAFFVSSGGDFDLRWFTPTVEVDLCGHATLAAACLITRRLEPERSEVRFHTRAAGRLDVRDDDDLLIMDFPALPPAPATVPDALAQAFGGQSVEMFAAVKNMAVLADEAAVRDFAPDFEAIAGAGGDGLIVTAPGEDCDFVSRYFAPHAGIPEDPVTGSAHCTLAPYWAGRLGKNDLHARQVSKRGGEVRCRVRGDRVDIAGHAVEYMNGVIRVE
ncbi:MAG: PhzF family phenazine biosynthesis protein [Alphaproteobacteria bacterium]